MIFFAEIICNTIDFRNFADKFHEDCYFVIWLIINSKYTKNNPLFRLLLKLFLRKRRTTYPELELLHNFTKIVTNLYFPYSVSWHDKDVNWYSYCIWKVPYYFFEFLSEEFQFSVESVTFFYSLLCTEKGREFCFLKYILLDIS